MPAARWGRWVENFVARHGEATLAVVDGALGGEASDGSWFTARLPLGRVYAGDATPAAMAAAVVAPDDWGLVLARRGGFAVARLHGTTLVSSKVGQRHVQGRTKAGGQSQQRFARRRVHQADQAWSAAAGHAATHLAGLQGPLVVAGDSHGLSSVVEQAGLAHLRQHRLRDLPGEPRRDALLRAVEDALALEVTVHNEA